MNKQEVRRQAMLQAMQVDVWLPRQQLVHAAASREYLLEWQAEAEFAVELAEPVSEAVAASSVQPLTGGAAATVPAGRTGQAYMSVRDKLASLQVGQTAKSTIPTKPETTSDTVELKPPTVAKPLEPIPRFTLQLLRVNNCLVLVDLPTDQPFQNRDPDYQLLRDMFRAAGLTDKPQLMRQGAPIVWPMLQSGSLKYEQNAAAARVCVRDLLSVELQAEPAACVWLVGAQSVRFASAEEDTPLYVLQPFLEGAQAWSLPSLEQVLDQPLLKRDIWRSMCEVRAVWQGQSDVES